MVEIEFLPCQVPVRREEQVHIRPPLPGTRPGGQGAAVLHALCAPRFLCWPVASLICLQPPPVIGWWRWEKLRCVEDSDMHSFYTQAGGGARRRITAIERTAASLNESIVLPSISVCGRGVTDAWESWGPTTVSCPSGKLPASACQSRQSPVTSSGVVGRFGTGKMKRRKEITEDIAYTVHAGRIE
jgi:hypothetical protein